MSSFLSQPSDVGLAALTSLEGVSAAFKHDVLLLAGWVHYLAFDLLVGRWIVQDSVASKVPHVLVRSGGFSTRSYAASSSDRRRLAAATRAGGYGIDTVLYGRRLPHGLRARPVGRVLAGSLAGLACSVVHAPISVLKNRLQVAQYADLRTAFLAVANADGLRGFYRGWASDASLEVLLATVQFVALDRLRALAPAGLPIAPWRNSAIGFAAGALTALCTEPLDVVKTRLTTQPLHPTSAAQPRGRGAKPSANLAAAAGGKAARAHKGRDGPDEYGGVSDALRQIARTEGTLALWRGLPQRVAYTELKGAIWYSAYEQTRVALGGALPRTPLCASASGSPSKSASTAARPRWRRRAVPAALGLGKLD
ncbi:mitochondrial carrier domain-containing protein [Pavlovales sp. CCMP2436]|nr:mitochondrial carrier domain-containing protein [Pavlovales sp. CCMP2436]